MKTLLFVSALAVLVVACDAPPRIEVRGESDTASAPFSDRTLPLGVGWNGTFRVVGADDASVEIVSESPAVLSVAAGKFAFGEHERKVALLPHRVGTVQVVAVVDHEVVARTTVTVVDEPVRPAR